MGVAVIRLDKHYVDPRLVELYDIENPRGPDTDFYLGLAAELDAHRILDLGCGTGLLTRTLATAGRQVIGIDPAPAMLAFARQQPGAERVRWVEGDAGTLGAREADLLVMTGNVAQVFLDDTDWVATLAAIHAALRPGGYLAFESRNPEDRGWERWNRAASYAQFDSPNGPMESWVELVSVGHGRVSFEGHNVFAATGEVVVVKSELRFRGLEELTRSLTDMGFTMERLYGDWNKGPLLSTSRIMIFVARRK
jgi:SAM-dependent methyltransferase